MTGVTRNVYEAITDGKGVVQDIIDELNNRGLILYVGTSWNSISKCDDVWCAAVDITILYEEPGNDNMGFTSDCWAYAGTGSTPDEAFRNAVQNGIANFFATMYQLNSGRNDGTAQKNLDDLISDIDSYISRYIGSFGENETVKTPVRVEISEKIARINDGSPDFRKIKDVKTAEKVLKMLENDFKFPGNEVK